MRTIFSKFFVFGASHLEGSIYELTLNEKPPLRTVKVDFSKSSQALLDARDAASWGAVEYDGGGAKSPTRLTGWWNGKGLVGSIYFSAWFVADRGIGDLFPPPRMETTGHPTGRDYEYTTAVYWPAAPGAASQDRRAGNRYFGFHASVLRRDGAEALLAIYHAGSSLLRRGLPGATQWVELEDPPEVDLTGPAGLTEIGPGAKDEGAIFIQDDYAFGQLELALREPKERILFKNSQPWLGPGNFDDNPR